MEIKEDKSENSMHIKSLINTLNEAKEELEYIDDIKIENIAITYNNKMVEISQLYKNRNVAIDDSELKLVIMYYLEKKLKEAFDCIAELTDVLKNISSLNKKIYGNSGYLIQKAREFSSRKEMELLKSKEEKIVNKYNEIDKEIFQFDIGKEILKIYETEKDFFDRVEKIVNRYNDGEHRFINNCNIDLKDLGYNVQIPCENQTKEKVITLFNIDDDISDIMFQKIEKIREKYKDYQAIETTLESHLIIIYSKATLELQDGEYEKYQNTIKDIIEFDDEKDLEKCVGEYLELSIDDPEENEKEDWNIIKDELNKLHKEDIIDTIEKDTKNRKYSYILEIVNEELGRDTSKNKENKKVLGENRNDF